MNPSYLSALLLAVVLIIIVYKAKNERGSYDSNAAHSESVPGSVFCRKEMQSNAKLLRRQVLDIDLNKEASPEPETEALSLDHSDKGTSGQDPRGSGTSSQKTRKYKVPKTWRKIDIPVSVMITNYIRKFIYINLSFFVESPGWRRTEGVSCTSQI